MHTITVLLDKFRQGDGRAFDAALALIYQDLKQIARAQVKGAQGQTLSATALVHECYLKLEKSDKDAIKNRAHFLALAARAMRQILIDLARDKAAQKRGSGEKAVDISEQTHIAAAGYESEQLLILEDALQTLEKTDARLVRVLECRVFGGLTEEETAAAINEPLRTTQRLWAEARSKIAALLSDD
jgi:RNA polymerase sigma factor (TIGR02999 family)